MIIVTGGAGLIGSAVIHKLNQLGREDILVVDHLGRSEKWKNIRALRFVDYMEKDAFEARLDFGSLQRLHPRGATGVEAVLHLGACSSTTESDATYLIKNNFEYTRKLALAALDNNARFIYASSAATYGAGGNDFTDDESLLSELKPMNIYGYSKHLFDLWALRQRLIGKIVGLKYFNVFGPNEHHKGDMRSVIAKAYEEILTTGSLKLFKSHRADYADGEQTRDFIYVKDAAAATVHFLINRQANGIFNIGSGVAASWNSLARAIFAAMERPVNIEYIDIPPSIRDSYQYHTRGDISKLRGAGFSAEITPLEDAVHDYVRNYLVPSKHLGD